MGRLSSRRRPKASAGVGHTLTSQVVSLAGRSIVVTFATASMLGPAGRGDLAFIIGTANLLGAIGFGSLHVGGTYAHKHGDASAPRTVVLLGRCPHPSSPP